MAQIQRTNCWDSSLLSLPCWNSAAWPWHSHFHLLSSEIYPTHGPEGWRLRGAEDQKEEKTNLCGIFIFEFHLFSLTVKSLPPITQCVSGLSSIGTRPLPIVAHLVFCMGCSSNLWLTQHFLELSPMAQGWNCVCPPPTYTHFGAFTLRTKNSISWHSTGWHCSLRLFSWLLQSFPCLVFQPLSRERSGVVTYCPLPGSSWRQWVVCQNRVPETCSCRWMSVDWVCLLSGCDLWIKLPNFCIAIIWFLVGLLHQLRVFLTSHHKVNLVGHDWYFFF